MIFDIITIFPDILDSYFKESILKRALENGRVKIRVHNLRNWTRNKHKTVDDTPYGGGPGMVMKVEPVYQAVKDIKIKEKRSLVILLAAKGKLFNQKEAQELTGYDQIIFICGRYEGVDERVAEYIADREISIGEYVLTGGELPAAVIIDSVVRLLPGVLGNKESLGEESFCQPSGQEAQSTLEYPQYTKPENFKDWKVPEILLSGNHAEIAKWRAKNKGKIKEN